MHADGKSVIEIAKAVRRFPRGVAMKLVALKVVDGTTNVKGYDDWVASGSVLPESLAAMQKQKKEAQKTTAQANKKAAITPPDDELKLESTADLSVRYAKLQAKKKEVDADVGRVGNILAAKIQAEMLASNS